VVSGDLQGNDGLLQAVQVMTPRFQKTSVSDLGTNNAHGVVDTTNWILYITSKSQVNSFIHFMETDGIPRPLVLGKFHLAIHIPLSLSMVVEFLRKNRVTIKKSIFDNGRLSSNMGNFLSWEEL
jgi:hypothetical protein